MAKLIAVVALCLVATVAAFTFEEMLAQPLVASFETEARTCPTTTCLGANADCHTTTNTETKVCPADQYKNVTTSTTCNCASLSAFPALGTVCSPTARNCGPMKVCDRMPGSTDVNDYKCYASRHIGDTCANNWECAPPRVCSSGKCAANLAAGAVCYNATTFMSTGMCPLTQYCPSTGTIGEDRVCTNNVAVGGSCQDGQTCVPFAVCGLTSSTTRTCDRYPFLVVADGADVNLMGGAGCVSGLANSTSGKCVNYDAEVAKWNAAFPNPASIACDTDDNCNLVGVHLAECVCTNVATGATPYCKRTVAPSLLYSTSNALSKSGGIEETGYNAGCESPTPEGSGQLTDTTYCASNWKSQILAAFCPVITAQTPSGYQCYADADASLCNGASALKSSVVMTLVVALVAFFTTQ